MGFSLIVVLCAVAAGPAVVPPVSAEVKDGEMLVTYKWDGKGFMGAVVLLIETRDNGFKLLDVRAFKDGELKSTYFASPDSPHFAEWWFNAADGPHDLAVRLKFDDIHPDSLEYIRRSLLVNGRSLTFLRFPREIRFED